MQLEKPSRSWPWEAGVPAVVESPLDVAAVVVVRFATAEPEPPPQPAIGSAMTATSIDIGIRLLIIVSIRRWLLASFPNTDVAEISGLLFGGRAAFRAATEYRIHGRVDGHDVEVWPTSVLRNASRIHA
jgi:hypothetical protein